MHTLELIAKAAKKEWIELPKGAVVSNEYCCITGKKTECFQRSKGLSAAFTAQLNMNNPDSDFVSIDAWQALKYRPERASSWIVTDREFIAIKKDDVRKYVFEDVQADLWAGYCTTSYKKHGGLIAPVNQKDKAYWLFETQIVDCSDKKYIQSIYDRLLSELKRGFGRTALETLDCPGFIMKKVGFKEWLDFERWAKPIYQSNIYKFMLYLLPAIKDLI